MKERNLKSIEICQEQYTLFISYIPLHSLENALLMLEASSLKTNKNIPDILHS